MLDCEAMEDLRTMLAIWGLVGIACLLLMTCAG